MSPKLTRLMQPVQSFFSRRVVWEFLLWCLPALVIGFCLRAVLIAQLPYAIYHIDTGDLMTTPHGWVRHHHWELHGKKTFLVPAVYTVLAVLKIPILLAIPVLQHLLGVIMIGLVGLLCRLWFERWRLFIVPLTLLVAVHPALLWYEHLLMPETAYVFGLALTAVAGTLYTLEQSRGRFAFLCGSLVLLAGARPEGKLLFGFAILLLLLLHAREWRRDWLRIVLLLAVAVATNRVTHTGQAGLLLYTSVARLTPAELTSAPGIEPYLAPIRAALQKRWEGDLLFPRVADRRLIADAVEAYLEARDPRGRFPSHDETNDLCLKMAAETCRRNLLLLPAYSYQKFRYGLQEPTYGRMDRHWVFDRQETAFVSDSKGSLPIVREITGQPLADNAQYIAFIHAHYRELAWFNQWAGCWNDALNAIRLPDERRVTSRGIVVRPRPALLYLLGLAGLVVIMTRRGKLWPFHLSWGLTLVGLYCLIFLTANVRGRFRFGLEPFWFIYSGLLLDWLLHWCVSLRRVRITDPSPPPAAPQIA